MLGHCCLVEDIVGQGSGGIDNGYDDACFADGLERPVYADLFNAVGRLADTGGVNEAEQVVAHFDGLFYRVACGSGNVGYDGTVITQQDVQERGFASVGGAYDGYRYAVFNSISGGK